MSYSKSYPEWRQQLASATGRPEDPFWLNDHRDIRDKPRNGAIEATMVEALWGQLGPLEIQWFAGFLPDVQDKYPEETCWVTPWTAVHAHHAFGMPPLFSCESISSNRLREPTIGDELVFEAWRALRSQHGLDTNPWALVSEMIDAYHTPGADGDSGRAYMGNVNPDQMQFLQCICPSNDWSLALACAGIGTTHLHAVVQHSEVDAKDQQAVAWLQWWMERLPECLTNLVWAGIVTEAVFRPEKTTDTQVLMDLLSGAKDPRDTFALARQLYSDAIPEPLHICNDSFQHLMGH